MRQRNFFFTSYELLDHQLQIFSFSIFNETIFEILIINLIKYIIKHIICEFAFCFVSICYEMILTIAKRNETFLFNNASCKYINILFKIFYINFFLYVENDTRNVKIIINRDNKQNNIKNFIISSYNFFKFKEITHHCREFVKRQFKITEKNKFTMFRAQLQKSISLMKFMKSIEIFKTKTIYEKLFFRVIIYSKMYQAIQAINISFDEIETFVIITMFTIEMIIKNKFVVNFVFMNGILHVAEFVVNLVVEHDNEFICKK